MQWIDIAEARARGAVTLAKHACTTRPTCDATRPRKNAMHMRRRRWWWCGDRGVRKMQTSSGVAMALARAAYHCDARGFQSYTRCPSSPPTPCPMNAPLMLLWGENDPWMTPTKAERIMEIKPSATYSPVPAGHCPQDDNPADSNIAFVEWVETVA